VTGRWGRSRTGAALAAVALALAGGGLGCSDDDSADTTGAGPTTTESAGDAEELTGSYVGTLDGTETYVAIVVADDGDALAFVTDGDQSVDLLDGFVDGEGARLGNDGGADLKVSFVEGATSDDPSRPVVLSGTFTRPDEAPLRFSAGAAEEPAGLYRASQVFADGEYEADWVVLPDGSQKGAVRRYETPLPPGAVDTVLDLGDLGDPDDPGSSEALSVEVPGGILHPIYVDPARL